MQQFLDQFGISPMQRVDMENFIYTQADKMVKGYAGGVWESHKVGNVWILVIPGSEPNVELVNYAFGGGMTADRLTASAAFSSIVSNWYMGLRAEQGRISGAAIDSISDYGYMLRSNCDKLPAPVEFLRFID